MGRQITDIEEETNVTVGPVRLTDLAPDECYARPHPQDQIEEIDASIRAFGFANPIHADLDDGGVIAAGHGPHMALDQMRDAEEDVCLPNGKVLPAGHVPVIDYSAWTEAQRRGYRSRWAFDAWLYAELEGTVPGKRPTLNRFNRSDHQLGFVLMMSTTGRADRAVSLQFAIAAR